MLLSFDTETSGLFDFKKPITDPGQPRLLQLAAVLSDNSGRERGLMSVLIRPDEWEVADGAFAVHGIATAQASAVGVPVVEALALFMRMLDQATHLIAFNLEFDCRVIERELFLLGANAASWKRGRLNRVCPMLLGAALRDDGKWPKLAWLYEYLFSEKHEAAHDGLADARAALRCYIELRRRGYTGERREAVA